jgi:hypothetical protein
MNGVRTGMVIIALLLRPIHKGRQKVHIMYVVEVVCAFQDIVVVCQTVDFTILTGNGKDGLDYAWLCRHVRMLLYLKRISNS